MHICYTCYMHTVMIIPQIHAVNMFRNLFSSVGHWTDLTCYQLKLVLADEGTLQHTVYVKLTQCSLTATRMIIRLWNSLFSIYHLMVCLSPTVIFYSILQDEVGTDDPESTIRSMQSVSPYISLMLHTSKP